LHGGHFYGGHICQLMDTMKACIANVADLLDRQLLLLCDPSSNRGLPANLVAADPAAPHHGFKAMQIGTSALVAEACKAAMPASVFSRSTENHNQDKVSLGTIAARDCLRVVELAERVAAVHALALAQAVDLRGESRGPGSERLWNVIRSEVPKNDGDRRMDKDIESVLRLYRQGALVAPELPFTKFAESGQA
jgi:histidine ammonia-lyase